MKRFASTRSELLPSQYASGRAQCSVGSIDGDGIRYGLTTHALIASTIATAPAMVLVDAIARRLPGAIREESGAFESFSAQLDGGLEYPHYTRPAEFRGWQVPDVLLSGDHARVAAWRREQSRLRSAA